MTANLEETKQDKKILIVSGERRGESAGRSKYNEIEIHRTNAEKRNHRIVHQWRCCIDYTESIIFVTLAENETIGERKAAFIMNAGMVMALVIMSIVAVVMITIGISQFCTKNNSVGFYNVIDPPKKEEIFDVIQWNKKHGFMWIIYGICIELGFWLGYVMPIELLEMFFMMGGVFIPLPFMVIGHHKLEKKYKIN